MRLTELATKRGDVAELLRLVDGGTEEKRSGPPTDRAQPRHEVASRLAALSRRWPSVVTHRVSSGGPVAMLLASAERFPCRLGCRSPGRRGCSASRSSAGTDRPQRVGGRACGSPPSAQEAFLTAPQHWMSRTGSCGTPPTWRSPATYAADGLEVSEVAKAFRVPPSGPSGHRLFES